MKCLGLPLLVMLLPNCGWNSSVSENNANSVNKSNLFDPVTITMIPDQSYQFKEGVLIGAGQKWHSDYSYQRAIIIGNRN